MASQSPINDNDSTQPPRSPRPPQQARRTENRRVPEQELPPYSPRSDPPSYAAASKSSRGSRCRNSAPHYPEPPTLARWMFFFGFMFPVFWIIGAYARSPSLEESIFLGWEQMMCVLRKFTGLWDRYWRGEARAHDGCQDPPIAGGTGRSIITEVEAEEGRASTKLAILMGGKTRPAPSLTRGEEREHERRKREAALLWSARCMFALLCLFVVAITVGLSMYGTFTAAKHRQR